MNREEPDFDALSGAVTEVRRLIAHLRKTTAPSPLLDEVRQDVAALAEKLASYDHPGPYAQRRLVLRADMDHTRESDAPDEFFPYSPIIGPLNPLAPPVDFRFDGEEMRAEHTFDAPYNGPPTAVHGGVIALVFDELLGSLGAMRDIGGFTGTLKVVYRSLTPLGKPIKMRSWVERKEGRKIFIHGTMHHGETLCSQAEGIFIQPHVSILEDALEKSHEELAND